MIICGCGKEFVDGRGMRHHKKLCVFAAEGKFEKIPDAVNTTVDLVTAEPVVEAPVELAEPVVEAPVAPIPTSQKVEVGTVLELNGTVLYNDMTEGSQYVETETKQLVVQVVSIQSPWVVCQAEGSTTFWSVGESDIGARHQIVVPDNSEEVASFKEALREYVDSRDAKLRAEKIYKKVDKEVRPVIWAYTERYGDESEAGKQDFVVEELNHKVHIVRVPGKEFSEYKMEEMSAWLEHNGFLEAIKKTVDINMWQYLKEAGKVPAEVIAAFEEPKCSDDSFVLKVSEIK